MVEAIIELRFLFVTVAVAALVSMAAYSVNETGAERTGRVGELTGQQWALIETSGLCDAAGGRWTPPVGLPGVTAGTCLPPR